MLLKFIKLPLIALLASILSCCTQSAINEKSTFVKISIPGHPVRINPMIYGQMLEDCNDRVIYGGVVGMKGEPRPHVDELMRHLHVPVMRWPGGTFVHEYHWENGIGPAEERPIVEVISWGGVENHQFGTDEFLQWCSRMNIEPYINLNMSTHPDYGGTLEESLHWIEYVNGHESTTYGKKRAENGHPDPYHVKYWCIGNENWGSFGVNTRETDAEYAARLLLWAQAIRERHPDLKLLAVGHTFGWDKTVLEQNGSLIDIITHHYYVHTPIQEGIIVDPHNSLFAPAKMEAHLKKIGTLLTEVNQALGRQDNPITISVDEWNNRHQVFDGENFKFTRHDPRRQFDVAVVACMLNAFVRQSEFVSMANYIFPVNGHGLIRTEGEDDAFRTSIYYAFELYRNLMLGTRLDVNISGPGIPGSSLEFSMEGDMAEMEMDDQILPFIDGACVLSDDGHINLTLTNRSPDKPMKVKIQVPDGFVPVKKWEISHPEIHAFNSADNRNEITAREETLSARNKSFVVQPCAWMLIQFSPK